MPRTQKLLIPGVYQNLTKDNRRSVRRRLSREAGQQRVQIWDFVPPGGPALCRPSAVVVLAAIAGTGHYLPSGRRLGGVGRFRAIICSGTIAAAMVTASTPMMAAVMVAAARPPMARATPPTPAPSALPM